MAAMVLSWAEKEQKERHKQPEGSLTWPKLILQGPFPLLRRKPGGGRGWVSVEGLS